MDFDRDIRPILSDTCYKCHGPDEKQRQAEFRLDLESTARKVIVAGQPEKSELYLRISSRDPEVHMPPPDSDLKLNAGQKDLIRRWIEQGADWARHWSFVPPRRPKLPAVKLRDWPHNGLDYFILSRLEREGWRPSPPADRATLIRRVTLDLTGLPPTPEEVDAFLADHSPRAYEKLVDRLLASPRWGERMAQRWLNAARYADTSGYQNDGPRFMWRWRDWVIEAFNRNLPYDRFTIEQLAGDLLTGPTLDQLIATGFNRNHRGNAEGGIIPEEFQVEYVVDRVDTTATVWLGLTLGCARCHDHKYDPLTQKEFYGIFAYFNNVPENGRAIKEGNSPPYIKAPTPAQRERLQRLETRVDGARREFQRLQPDLAAAQAAWEDSARRGNVDSDWTVTDGLVARFGLDGDVNEASGKPAVVKDGKADFVTGRMGRAVQLDGHRYVDAGDLANFGYLDKFSLAAWVYPHGNQGGTILSRMTDEVRADGYYLQLIRGKVQVNLVKRWLDDSIRVETAESIPANRWTHVAVAYDGSRVADGIRVYLNGKPARLVVRLDGINQTFAAKAPLRIGGGNGPGGRFHGAIDDVRVYDRDLSPQEAEIISTAESINEILAVVPNKRTPSPSRKLRSYFLARRAPAHIRRAARRLAELEHSRRGTIASLPTVMVMQEMKTPRPTFVLTRGEYNKPGEQVSPGTPASLPPLPPAAPANRLGLARWLVDADNPLTARVAVNRYWQMFFGQGLVRTVEDFGSQGERPSHPLLLDWLATQFVRLGWDVKAVQRLIVTSAAYRQSSRVTPRLLAGDPANRLLARGPRFRLSAETIRDQALAASGLLVERFGGPSVKPYQPDGLWQEIATDQNYDQSHGANLYRRSLYTYWKRTVAPPTMTTLDASPRETCTVRQTRTNTPLQALALMNDVTFVEAARLLAERVMERAKSPGERLALAFRRATGRTPGELERRVLAGSLRYHRARYEKDPSAAGRFISLGEHAPDKRLPPQELAAYAAVCAMILNLDEVLSKE